MLHFLILLSSFAAPIKIPNTNLLRIQDQIHLMRKQLGVEVEVSIDIPKQKIRKGLFIECLERIQGCTLKASENSRQWNLTEQDYEDILDVSRRAFPLLGLTGAAERSLFVLSQRLRSSNPPPWRRLTPKALFFDEEVVFPRDNLQAGHFMVEYISDSIRHLGVFPTWFFSQGGGVWFEPFHINFYLTAPHRFVGYFLAKYSRLSPEQLYKIPLVFVGVPLFLFGVFLLAWKLFQNITVAFMTTLLCFLSSICMAFIHNEQILGSLFFIPYLWYLFLSLKERPRYIYILSTVFGLTLTIHYPYLTLGYLLILVLSLTFTLKDLRQEIAATCNSVWEHLTLLRGILVILCFAVPLSPSIYTYFSYSKALYSPLRGVDLFDSVSYEEYEKRYVGSIQGMDKKVFGLFLGLTKPDDLMHEDHRIIFWNIISPIALFLLFFIRFKGKWFQITALVLCGLFSLGVQTPIPRILYSVFPGIGMFRMWNFFIIFFNLHLMFLTVYSIRVFLNRYPFQRAPIVLLFIVIAFFSSVNWLGNSWQRYQRVISRNTLDYYSLRSHSSYVSKTWFDENLVYKGSPEFFVPKGIPLGGIKKLNSESPVHWVKDSGLSPLKKIEDRISQVKGGFHFDLREEPLRGNSLAIHQYNDGNWMAVDDFGKELPIGSSQFMTIQIPIEDSTTGITLKRRFNIFPYLFFGMWLPLFLCLAYEMLEKRARLFDWIGVD